MSPAQKRLRELLDRQSHDRQRALEIAQLDELDDAQRTELDGIERRAADTERGLRACRAAVEEEDRNATIDKSNAPPDAETRARHALRSRARVGDFLSAALTGRPVQGASAELQQASGLDGIPFELWDTPNERRDAPADSEQRAITAAPTSGTGVNLEPLIPQVFSPSIAARLNIDMPMAASGMFSTARVVHGTDPATAVAKSAAVPEVASTWVVETTGPHRIGSALRLTLEDIAVIGQAGFETILRQHVSLLVSDELDNQMINGDSSVTSDDIDGVFAQLGNPAAPAAAVETWTRFLAIQSGGIEGLWATELDHIGLTVGVETYQLAAATFQGTDSEESAASYLKRMGAGEGAFFTNSRMPAKVNHVQQGILCRKGRTMMPAPMRVAVCPHWGYFSIDDIYTGASKGERVFTINTLVGDVILTQPTGYSQVAFRVSV